MPPRGETEDSGIDLVGAELEKEIVADALDVLPAVEPVDSGIDWAAVEAPASAIDLGQAHVVDSAAPEELSDIAVVDSGLILLNADSAENLPAVPSTADVQGRPASDVALDLSGEDITVAKEDSGPLDGIEKNSPDSSESGRDLIAEEVESSLDMPLDEFDVASGDSGQQGDAVAGQLASEEEEVDLTEMSANTIDSSSVDLGASATFPAAPPEPVSEPKPVESTRPYQAKSKSIHGGEELSPSEVNLGGDHAEPSKSNFFDESGGLGGSGVPLETTASETSGLLAESEPAAWNGRRAAA